jgi:hypothetical protein
MLRQWLLSTVAAAALGSAAAPAAARVDFSVHIGPPPPRVEFVPPPRVGYVWVPGYWGWYHGRHAWVPGTWVHARPGYLYAPPVWARHDGRWVLYRGHWRHRDRDRDGIPNRYDRDRDGDGIPNRYDRHPDNWRRP